MPSLDIVFATFTENIIIIYRFNCVGILYFITTLLTTMDVTNVGALKSHKRLFVHQHQKVTSKVVTGVKSC